MDLNLASNSLLPLFLRNYWIDLDQISYVGSPWVLVVHFAIFKSIRNPKWPTGGHLEFSLLPLFRRTYWMDLDQISYEGSPWALVVHCIIQVDYKSNIADRRPVQVYYTCITTPYWCYEHHALRYIWSFAPFTEMNLCMQI